MLGIVSEDENHNKIFKPMAGATLGQGVPLGTWASFEKDYAPNPEWLEAGTDFDANAFPALAMYLGGTKVPERYDHSRPSEFQTLITRGTTVRPFTAEYDADITIELDSSANRYVTVNGDNYEQTSITATNSITLSVKKGDIVSCTGSSSISAWAIYGVYYSHPMFIKATPTSSNSDYQGTLQAVMQYVRNMNSYSTEEKWTGGYWIDGKPIYRVVKPLFTDTETVAHNLEVTSYTIPNIDVTNWKQIISSHGTCVSGNSGTNSDELDGKARLSGSNNVFTSVQWQQKNNYNGVKGVYIEIEYTKTND